jgi:ribonuclease E
MTVVDVNTGKFVGSGGNLEETVTKNNVEAAEEIVRQLRLRDIGGIIVIDFIDMVLESNRDLVLRRLVECLSRDRTKHQVAEVTSLGLVQMTRKKLGLGLLETFSENCEVCAGRGVVVQHDPVTKHRQQPTQGEQSGSGRRGRNRGGSGSNNGGGNGGGNNAGSGGNGGSQNQQSNGASKSANTGSTNGAASGSNGTHAITDDVRNALARVAASTVAASAEHAADEQAAVAEAPSTDKKSGSSNKSRSSRNGGSSRKPDVAKTDEKPEAKTQKSTPQASDVVTAAADAAVAMLDLPASKNSPDAPKISTHDAEQILGSVLEALPEPKQPGQGRSRGSRRAGSQGKIVTATPSEDQ